MTYVYNYSASGIKRKPTEEEIESVKKQELIEASLYKYYENLDKKTTEKEVLKWIWSIYLKELEKYNKLFDLYMGYCY